MKIIYEYEDAAYGIVVVKQKPQVRTIWANSPRCLQFPYVINVITYDKTKDGLVSYGGIYRTGLVVLFANKSPKTLDDIVYICPMEIFRSGLVCTPHVHDGKCFKSLNELVFFVTSIWWQLHHGDFVELIDWKKETGKTILKKKWNDPTTIRQAIEFDYPAIVGYGRQKREINDGRAHTSITIPSADKDLINKDLKLKLDLKF